MGIDVVNLNVHAAAYTRQRSGREKLMLRGYAMQPNHRIAGADLANAPENLDCLARRRPARPVTAESVKGAKT
jgi:hypothetical protein